MNCAITNDDPRIPAAERESIANGVTYFRKQQARKSVTEKINVIQ
jgi:hypothetical protein